MLIPAIQELPQAQFVIAQNTVPYSGTQKMFPVESNNVVTREEFEAQLQTARRSGGDYARIWRSRPCIPVPDAERDEYVSAMVDYRKKNEASTPLDRNFSLPSPYQMVDVSELEPDKKIEIAAANGGLGLYEVSGVGFSSDKTVAIVYVGFHCMLCGRWSLHILKKRDGQWLEVSHGCSWMS